MNTLPRFFHYTPRFACALIALPLLVTTKAMAQVSVDAKNDIYRAGSASLGGDGGTNPVMITVPGGTSYLTFSVTASNPFNSLDGITLNTGGGINDADGKVIAGSDNGPTIGSGSGYSFNNSTGGLSGITEPGIGALVGVFESPTSLTNPAPTNLNYYSGSLTPGSPATPGTYTDPTQATFSPALDQVFLIGDGLTGDGSGSVQDFYIPNGATELVLGISDAPYFDGNDGGPGAYGDNSGTYQVAYETVSANASVPDAGTTGFLLGGALTGLAALRRRFAK